MDDFIAFVRIMGDFILRILNTVTAVTAEAARAGRADFGDDDFIVCCLGDGWTTAGTWDGTGR
ncbi:hypothetical protein CCR95_16435 [Thiocystis minor]|nr:hypothetical protein [Thiocystis minor]